jgi:hypothetical protein
MKNLKEIIESGEKFTLSKQDEIKYNAMDHDDFKTGINHKKERVFNCIYSVWKIEGEIAYCQQINAWGQLINETHKLEHLTSYTHTRRY